MEFAAGSTVTIAGRRCAYTVKSSSAVEGGGYELTLDPAVAPFITERLEVYQTKTGLWHTEQLGDVHVEPAEKPMPAGCRPCKSCGAPMRWSRTDAGKWIPLNPDGTPHHETCPQASEWRSGGPKKAEPEEKPSEPERQLSLF